MSSIKKMKNGHSDRYWRSLDELAATPAYQKFAKYEFPEGADQPPQGLSRRHFLGLMGASMALAGLTSCRKPVEKIVPYVKPPEEIIPGLPKYYATTVSLGSEAVGVLVEAHEGRPTKIEGNEDHPASRGAASMFLQASILNLYDPDRSKFPLEKGAQKAWPDFVAFWNGLRGNYAQNGGQGLAVLAESSTSPTYSRLKKEFLKQYPNARWASYEPVSDENIYEGLRIATGQAYQPIHQFESAAVVLSLDADFLGLETNSLAASRGFAGGRRLRSEKEAMNRLYVVESMYTTTGAMADHRLALPPGRVAAFVSALAVELAKQGLALPAATGLESAGESAFNLKWLQAAARDLLAARGRSLVLAGRRQPAAVHALVFAINKALGNVGATVQYVEPRDKDISRLQGLTELISEIHAGNVEILIVLGGNPAYNAPADLKCRAALKKVQHLVHLGSHVNETAVLAEWHIPESHFLEAWGDARAVDGTLSVVQPVIAPLFESRSKLEFLQFLTSGEEKSGHEAVRQTWQAYLRGANFEKRWRRVLHDGLLSGSALPWRVPRLRPANLRAALAAESGSTADGTFEIVFQASASVFDGRFANNGWLQEVPDPQTKLTWDNAALISPATAERLGVQSEDLVQVEFRGRSLTLPAWISPGMADDCVVVELGYGRRHAGRIGNRAGFNAYALRTTKAHEFGPGARLKKAGGTYHLATTQHHWSMENRPIVREASLEEYRAEPHFAEEMVEHPPLKNLWREHKYDKGYQWGMTIDLNVCTGCSACVIACQSENNIPIVGKEQVIRGREMHWIRIDRYYKGAPEMPEMVQQPVACHHCENAPCESVCPVQATVHDQEGLNVMAYNRCIGTRYCSNNCPYKVRRFNFFNFTKDTPEIVKMAMNPDVTVRARGVMEKCTYCLQRINEAKISAKNAGRDVQDGEIRTACQQTCPTDAIVFGNINDPDSRVSQTRAQNRKYDLLGEFNTRPRTSYLAKIRNPNPELAVAREDAPAPEHG